MLVRDDGATWTAITQPAHARLAGRLAAHLPGPPDPDLVLAVEQHDVAWSSWDRTPPLHPEARRAAAFTEADVAQRQAIWAHVTHRLDALSPYAAVLVSLHCTNIHTRYRPAAERPVALLEQARAEQDALLARLPDRGREAAEADADRLFALDALSLLLCREAHRPSSRGPDGRPVRELPPLDGVVVRVEPRGDHHALAPWPFVVDAIEVDVPARTFTERFDDEAALHVAMAAAPYHRLVFALRPG